MRDQSFDLIELLILENNHDDLLLMEYIFEENKFFNKFRTVKSVNEIVELINKIEFTQDSICPEIALISLSSLISEKNINAIEELKHPALKNIELFIFTNDEVEEDLLKEHGISFPTIHRPFTFCSFMETIISKDDLKQAIIRTY